MAISVPQKLEMVQVLLAAGSDVNIPEEKRIGASILQSAIATGDEELVSILLKEGASVNSLPIGKAGRTPVQEAAKTGNLSLIKLLLESGANINAPAGDYYGRTALQAASSSELPTMELIDFLLDAGAEMNAPAGELGGVTALQGAAIRGHMRIALQFLEAGADVNAAPAIVDGRTALDGAAEYGRLDMVQMLLNAGACGDSTKSHRFEKAIELARDNGHFAITSLLERAQKKPLNFYVWGKGSGKLHSLTGDMMGWKNALEDGAIFIFIFVGFPLLAIISLVPILFISYCTP